MKKCLEPPTLPQRLTEKVIKTTFSIETAQTLGLPPYQWGIEAEVLNGYKVAINC